MLLGSPSLALIDVTQLDPNAASPEQNSQSTDWLDLPM
jgi:hypothetical protein